MGDPLFVFDDQCHYFNFDLSNRTPPGRIFLEFVEGFREVMTGTHITLGQQKKEEFMEEVFTKSCTTMAGLNALGLVDIFGGNMIGDVEDHASLVKKYPNRVILYGYVNPLDGAKALEQMEHQVHDLGARAFKLYPIDPKGSTNGWLCNDSKVAYPVFEKAAELGIKIICVHKGVTATAGPHKGVLKYLDPDDMEDPTRDFPKINFFCYHMAYPEVEKVAALCSLYKNFYTDMGVPVSVAAAIRPLWFNDMMKKFLTLAPATKMTWGTDQISIPMAQSFIEAFWKWQVPEEWESGYGISPITEDVKRKIFGGTMAEMFQIDIKKAMESVKDDEFTRRQTPEVQEFLSKTSS